jgi:hypothetical protein
VIATLASIRHDTILIKTRLVLGVCLKLRRHG